MQFDYQIIEEKFKSLPEEMQYAMTSPSVADKIRSIANKYGLLLDQMESLFDITSYVMLGLLPSNKFTSTLAKELNISEKQAQLIISDINNEIFSEVKNSMREFEELSKTKSVEDTDNTKTSEEENQLPVSTNSPTSTPQTNISDGEEMQASTSPDTNSEIVSKPTHITDLEKAGGFTIEHENSSLSNNTMIDGVGSDVLRAGPVRDRWAPVQQTIVPKGVSIPTPTQAPKTEPVARPAPVVEQAPVVTPAPIISTPTPTVSIPTPIATPISEPVTPTQPISIPEKISITVPEQVAPIAETATPASIPPTQPVIPEQKIAGVSSTVLNPGSWPTKPKIDVVPKKEEKVFESAPTKKTPPVPPINLPKEEIKKIDDSNEIKEAIEKAKKSEAKKEEIPVFNLDSYIKKTDAVVEPIKEPTIPKVTVPPTPIKIETVTSTPPPITPPKIPSTPVLPPTPPTPIKPPTPPTPVPPPIPVNPVKVTATTAPQPPKARGFDPYREPVQ